MTESRTVLAVVLSIAVLALFGLIGSLLFSWHGRAVPESVTAATSVAIGSLASLLASTRTKPPATGG